MSALLLHLRDPKELTVDIGNFVDSTESVSEVLDILRCIYTEQNEHNFQKFSDAYVKYRKVVAEWMIDVADYFNLHPTTTHSAIAYLDRLQPNERFSRFEWQMLAICCLLISSKYNECEEHVPTLKSLEEITQQKISNECVLNYELWSLKRMGWKLNARTPVSFLSSYLVVGVIFHDDKISSVENIPKITPATVKSSMFSLATKCILVNRFKGILASATACAIVYHVRKSLGIYPAWRRELSLLTGHVYGSDLAFQEALFLLETMDRESSEEDDKEVQSILAAVETISLNNHGSVSNLTPDHCNKENKKPSLESELSPVSIANLGEM